MKTYTQKFITNFTVILPKNKHLHTFINRRFGAAQPVKTNTYVLIVNKATQIGISKKIQSQKTGPYNTIDTPHIVYLLTEKVFGETNNSS